jgi:hypothetical protein
MKIKLKLYEKNLMLLIIKLFFKLKILICIYYNSYKNNKKKAITIYELIFYQLQI